MANASASYEEMQSKAVAEEVEYFNLLLKGYDAPDTNVGISVGNPGINHDNDLDDLLFDPEFEDGTKATATIIPFPPIVIAEPLPETPAPSIAVPVVVTTVFDAVGTSEPCPALVEQENPRFVPPAFRAREWVNFGSKGLAGTPSYTPEETARLNEDQMEDLRWLSQYKLMLAENECAAIFIQDGLDEDLAREFVVNGFAKHGNLKMSQKAKALGLTEFQRLQCRMFRTDKEKRKHKAAKDYAANIRMRLRTLAETEIDLAPHIENFINVAHAEYLSRGFQQNTKPQFLSWLTGEKEISRQAFASRLMHLNKRLKKC